MSGSRRSALWAVVAVALSSAACSTSSGVDPDAGLDASQDFGADDGDAAHSELDASTDADASDACVATGESCAGAVPCCSHSTCVTVVDGGVVTGGVCVATPDDAAVCTYADCRDLPCCFPYFCTPASDPPDATTCAYEL